MSAIEIYRIINTFRKALLKTKDDTAKLVGEKAASDIRTDYRSKAGLIGNNGYTLTIGENEIVLERSTEEMARSVKFRLNNEGVWVFFDRADEELFNEARMHELFGEIRPWRDFRQEAGRFVNRKAWIDEIFKDIGAEVKVDKGSAK